MPVKVRQVGIESLSLYATVPDSFVAASVFRIEPIDKGCRQLKIETQNVNVPACRFYAKQGCQLGAIHRYGYAGCPDVAHEAMLLWYLEL